MATQTEQSSVEAVSQTTDQGDVQHWAMVRRRRVRIIDSLPAATQTEATSEARVVEALEAMERRAVAVSYTHLTLPTKA